MLPLLREQALSLTARVIVLLLLLTEQAVSLIAQVTVLLLLTEQAGNQKFDFEERGHFGPTKKEKRESPEICLNHLF